LGDEQATLAVLKANYDATMYGGIGFKTIDENVKSIVWCANSEEKI